MVEDMVMDKSMQSSRSRKYSVGEFKMFFDSGCPAMFWLYVDTAALYDLQALNQVGVLG